MKGSTYFKPSIHGWPFGNSWDWTIETPIIPLEITLTDIGFCGGMCWTALDRFFDGICLPRDIGAPVEGTDLYGEILLSQIASAGDVDTLMKMYEWQMSPKLSGHWGNPHRSLGSKTLVEWHTKVRNYFLNPSPQENKPVTLTLIATSNDYDPFHLSAHHRVIAYGFEERELYDDEYVHGERNAKIRHVKLYIYDPNHPNDDDVYLTFYTNCDDHWIRLRHSEDKKYTGFFVDDLVRNYSSTDDPEVHIEKLELSEFTSATNAMFDLKFNWKSRTIPYFCVQIDGVDWGDNAAAKASLSPEGNIKQCPAITGSQTIELELPRSSSTVTVRYLDEDSLSVSADSEVGKPYFRCSPWYWGQNQNVQEQDFFFKDKNPSPDSLNQLSSPESRNVFISFSPAYADSEIAFPWTDLLVNGQLTEDFFDTHMVGDHKLPPKTYLGNINKALRADFTVRNLAPPVDIWAFKKTTEPGRTTNVRLPALPERGAFLFDGFTPADYDSDTKIEFRFLCRDKFGVLLEDTYTIHAKSVIHFDQSRLFPELPPMIAIGDSGPSILSKNIAKYEAVAHRLVEMGLLDFKSKLDPTLDLGPVRRTDDPRRRESPAVKMLKAIRADRRIQQMIKETSRAVWRDQGLWNRCLKHNSEALSREIRGGVMLYNPGDYVDRVAGFKDDDTEIQRMSDAGIIGVFAESTLKKLRRDPGLKRALDDL